MKRVQHSIGRRAIIAASIAAALVLATARQSQAGTIITFTFTGDATSQISSSKTYLTKADPGLDATSATINGVAFEAGALTTSTLYTATNMTLALTSGAGVLALNAGNANDTPSGGGGSATLLTDMVNRSGNAGTAGTVLTLTFTGLTLGTQYSARIYYRQWSSADPRNNVLFFDEDGAGALGTSSGTVSEDAGTSDGVANVIGYNFTAQNNGSGGALPLVVTVTQAVDNNSWHFYGMTNEVVPEPSSLALLGLTTSGFMIWRRRRRA
ncbi:MAG: fibronectin-binding autotransporter adhesin [Chthoniobacter sp.]|jgi:hypothetical protein|nr:fibronectin-binding autotransporter adhesin [Chthoniobacter sp.]